MQRFSLGRVLSEDALSLMSDSDLQGLLKDIRHSISDSRRSRRSTKSLEVECCYVQRELDDRHRYSSDRLEIKRPPRRREFQRQSR